MAQCLGDFQKIWFEHGPVTVNDDESYLMTKNYTMTCNICKHSIYPSVDL